MNKYSEKAQYPAKKVHGHRQEGGDPKLAGIGRTRTLMGINPIAIAWHFAEDAADFNESRGRTRTLKRVAFGGKVLLHKVICIISTAPHVYLRLSKGNSKLVREINREEVVQLLVKVRKLFEAREIKDKDNLKFLMTFCHKFKYSRRRNGDVYIYWGWLRGLREIVKKHEQLHETERLLPREQ